MSDTAFKRDVLLASPEATENLARDLSLWAKPGFLVLLDGELGAGKSTFARAFIRALFKPGDDSDVPSPSFSLLQTYDELRVPVFHADLYRISTPQEVDELGLEQLLESHCGLIEWASKLPRKLSDDVASIRLNGNGPSRTAQIEASGHWLSALKRDDVIKEFLSHSTFKNATRQFFEGDASSRRYEKLVSPTGETCLLMDMPQRSDGPPVKDGKPYSAIAHLAEDITAVVAINKHLVGLGYSAPKTFRADLAKGLALIEPLGEQVYGKMYRAGENMRVPLEAAVELLANMTLRHWPSQPLAEGSIVHTISDYDEQAQLIEVDLLPSWYIPYARNLVTPDTLKQEFATIWKTLLPLAIPIKPQWVLRDFHSPNLLWMPEREGIKRVGLIDTQDAVMGHAAYDLMSLAQDARVDVSVEMEQHLVAHYCGLRKCDDTFDEVSFRAAYAVLGAQRATKILGIFARLSKRDGKHVYLEHMPRVSRYLRRNLQHPVLNDLHAWLKHHLPEALTVGDA